MATQFLKHSLPHYGAVGGVVKDVGLEALADMCFRLARRKKGRDQLPVTALGTSTKVERLIPAGE